MVGHIIGIRFFLNVQSCFPLQNTTYTPHTSTPLYSPHVVSAFHDCNESCTPYWHRKFIRLLQGTLCPKQANAYKLHNSRYFGAAICGIFSTSCGFRRPRPSLCSCHSVLQRAKQMQQKRSRSDAHHAAEQATFYIAISKARG